MRISNSKLKGVIAGITMLTSSVMASTYRKLLKEIQSSDNNLSDEERSHNEILLNEKKDIFEAMSLKIDGPPRREKSLEGITFLNPGKEVLEKYLINEISKYTTIILMNGMDVSEVIALVNSNKNEEGHPLTPKFTLDYITENDSFIKSGDRQIQVVFEDTKTVYAIGLEEKVDQSKITRKKGYHYRIWDNATYIWNKGRIIDIKNERIDSKKANKEVKYAKKMTMDQPSIKALISKLLLNHEDLLVPEHKTENSKDSSQERERKNSVAENIALFEDIIEKNENSLRLNRSRSSSRASSIANLDQCGLDESSNLRSRTSSVLSINNFDEHKPSENGCLDKSISSPMAGTNELEGVAPESSDENLEIYLKVRERLQNRKESVSTRNSLEERNTPSPKTPELAIGSEIEEPALSNNEPSFSGLPLIKVEPVETDSSQPVTSADAIKQIEDIFSGVESIIAEEMSEISRSTKKYSPKKAAIESASTEETEDIMSSCFLNSMESESAKEEFANETHQEESFHSGIREGPAHEVVEPIKVFSPTEQTHL